VLFGGVVRGTHGVCFGVVLLPGGHSLLRFLRRAGILWETHPLAEKASNAPKSSKSVLILSQKVGIGHRDILGIVLRIKNGLVDCEDGGLEISQVCVILLNLPFQVRVSQHWLCCKHCEVVTNNAPKADASHDQEL
jgi:hypothetical protein